MIYGKALTCKGNDITGTATRDMQIETIVIPGSGSPMTYASYLYDPDQEEEEVREATGFFIPKNITISSAEEARNWDVGMEFWRQMISNTMALMEIRLLRILAMDLLEQKTTLLHLCQMEQIRFW